MIINYSTGAIGIPLEKRIDYLRELRPDVAALNMGSMNYAKYSKRRKDFVFSTVFENSFETIIDAAGGDERAAASSPSTSASTPATSPTSTRCSTWACCKQPLQISCVMGVTGGIRPNARNLAHMAENIPGGPDGPNEWGVIGISRDQWTLIAAALTLGGNIRAGVEDNFYLPDGSMARSNGDLIAKARQMAEDVGRRPATVAEARAMLGTPRRAVAGVEPSTAGAARERAASGRSRASRSSTSRACCPAASARCCSPTSAPRS